MWLFCIVKLSAAQSKKNCIHSLECSLVYYRRLCCKVLQELCKSLLRVRNILQDLAKVLQDKRRSCNSCKISVELLQDSCNISVETLQDSYKIRVDLVRILQDKRLILAGLSQDNRRTLARPLQDRRRKTSLSLRFGPFSFLNDSSRCLTELQKGAPDLATKEKKTLTSYA